MLTPWLMLASTLSTVTTRGELMVLMVPLFSAARGAGSVGGAPRAAEDEAEAATVVEPIGAGMLTAKFGWFTPWRPEMERRDRRRRGHREELGR